MKIIRPQWPAPANVVAFSTTRPGGFSTGIYAGLNIATHVDDDLNTVIRNRQLLAAQLPANSRIQWLKQVHDCEVVEATDCSDEPCADASWASSSDVACAVMTADCLPVLFCAKGGEAVAAAHAGWRGLAAGVLEATVAAMPAAPARIMAWLGPAIGPNAFEVGAEVREQFLSQSSQEARQGVSQCFVAATNKPDFYLADLYTLARIRLKAAGIGGVYGGDLCTFNDSHRFYSYRRDGETGRMATVIVSTP